MSNFAITDILLPNDDIVFIIKASDKSKPKVLSVYKANIANYILYIADFKDYILFIITSSQDLARKGGDTRHNFAI